MEQHTHSEFCKKKDDDHHNHTQHKNHNHNGHFACPLCSIFMNPRPKSGKGADYIPSNCEEFINFLTHFFPIFFFIYYSIQIFEDEIVNSWKEALCVISYGAGMVLLFGVSSSYHLLCFLKGRQHKWAMQFRIFDHATIFVFIAASYTPWLTLIEFEYGIGGVIALFIWLFCLMGLMKMFLPHKTIKMIRELNNVALLNIMGWAGFVIVPIGLLKPLPVEAFICLVLGGCFFSGGCLFLVYGNGIIPFSHGIWHFAVFLGVLSHFTAMYAYLLNLDSIYHPEHVHMTTVLDQIISIFSDNSHDWKYPHFLLNYLQKGEVIEYY